MIDTTTLAPGARPAAPATRPRAARTALALMDRIQEGALALHLPDGDRHLAGHGEPRAMLEVHDWAVFGRTLAKGDIGLAESWIAGEWSTHDLPAVLRVLVRNRAAIETMVYGSFWGRLAHRLLHLTRRNSRAGSRRNIAAHYDLGNDFYRLWLDDTWNYSSALFGDEPGRTLEAAQDAKVRRALDAAGVRPGSRLLEIGCGWGALAEMAASQFGAEVVGVTLSHEQLAHARERLSGRADLRLQDYRDIGDGPFDAICSIEMLEAVGRGWWPAYFAQVERLLAPGGRACIQTIVIDDALWPRYIRGTDFIQQFVFPGGCLPCPSEFERHAREAGLEVVDRFAFGQDYARTLRHWRERFLARRADVAALGFDEPFLRLWDFYLAYCEIAFEQCNTDVVQYTLRKPG
jgi:cyclopropane-fatty-acyl-phospholipid synthase